MILLTIFILLVAISAPAWITQSLVFVYAGLIRLNSLRMWIASFAGDRRLQQPAVAAEEDSLAKAQRLAVTAILNLYLIEEEQNQRQHEHQA